MADENLPLASQWEEILKNLGQEEPTTRIEAQALLERIRADKGYLDEETLCELRALPERNRAKILRVAEKSRETQAAYTKR